MRLKLGAATVDTDRIRRVRKVAFQQAEIFMKTGESILVQCCSPEMKMRITFHGTSDELKTLIDNAIKKK